MDWYIFPCLARKQKTITAVRWVLYQEAIEIFSFAPTTITFYIGVKSVLQNVIVKWLNFLEE